MHRLWFNLRHTRGSFLGGGEGCVLLFVHVELVLCACPLREGCPGEGSAWSTEAVQHKHINHTLLRDTDLVGCLLAHFNTSTKMTEV